MERQVRWPSKTKIWTVGAHIFGVAVLVSALYGEYLLMSPLARWWFPDYVLAWVSTSMGHAEAGFRELRGIPRDGSDPVPIIDNDLLVPAATTDANGHASTVPFELSDTGRRYFRGLVLGPLQRHKLAVFQNVLRDKLYDGFTVSDLLLRAFYGAAAAWLLGLMVGIKMDGKRETLRRQPQRMRGAELLTVPEFNARMRSVADDFRLAFRTLDRTFADRILFRQAPDLLIPLSKEAEHFMVVGAPGTGKTSLIRQMLLAIQSRNEIAILNDPAGEFIEEFYDAGRGDVELNPLSQRMPFWEPSAELEHPAEALTLAESMFPDDPAEKTFFIDSPRDVFAYLLKMRMTNEELIHVLSSEEEILRVLEQTEVKSVIHKHAHDQRAGVLAKLNRVAAALKLLPKKEQTSRRWTATEWCKTREGWLFLTSSPATRKAQLPLTSLWLDTLILRLINQGQRGKKAWFILDELAMLQHLPQLHVVLTEGRKSGNPIALAFHSCSQIDKRYGLDAKAIMSSPATKFFLRVGDTDGQKLASDTIGKAMMVRLQTTDTTNNKDGESRSETQSPPREEPLVMPSEIAGLDDREGYLQYRNWTVKFRFPYIQLPKRAPGLILRPSEDQFAPKPRIFPIGDRTPAKALPASAQNALPESTTPESSSMAPPRPPEPKEPPASEPGTGDTELKEHYQDFTS